MEVKFVDCTRKTGQEMFMTADTPIGPTVADFWFWAHSDLVGNTERGKLAEFIVATALGVANGVSKPWGKYDLDFMGKGIEIKSSAYLQSWYQEKESQITFGVQPTQGWDESTNTYETERKRQADVYVFCLLKHRDKRTLNPLDTEQWIFFVVPTLFLNEKLPTQKKTSLAFFRKNGIASCSYSELRSAIEACIASIG